MTVYSRFYSFDDRKYYSVVAKKCSCIDEGIVRAKRYIRKKYNVTRLCNTDYSVRHNGK